MRELIRRVFRIGQHPRAAGPQEYILSAAYDRATAVENAFLDAFRASMAHSQAAFADEASTVDRGAQQRAAELQARHELDGRTPGRGHAA
ncbi:MULTISPECIES: hypothetical protein [unclassified Streptomyces]|uniref:hypothetical protein n=1 Tax=unclassified Streptomyces TaxID=2593676 RepID=UPI0036E286FC